MLTVPTINKNKFIPLIIPAAGFSTRMGQPKGLINWRGTTLIDHQFQIISKVELLRPFIILRTEQHEYDSYLDNFPIVQRLHNMNPERGMFYSLQLGLFSANAGKSGAFILPLDTPSPPALHWNNMLEQKKKYGLITTYNKKRGHPVYLSSTLVKKMLIMSWDMPEARLDFLLEQARSAGLAQEFNCPYPETILNLNFPKDVTAAQPKIIPFRTAPSDLF